MAKGWHLWSLTQQVRCEKWGEVPGEMPQICQLNMEVIWACLCVDVYHSAVGAVDEPTGGFMRRQLFTVRQAKQGKSILHKVVWGSKGTTVANKSFYSTVSLEPHLSC